MKTQLIKSEESQRRESSPFNIARVSIYKYKYVCGVESVIICCIKHKVPVAILLKRPSVRPRTIYRAYYLKLQHNWPQK